MKLINFAGILVISTILGGCVQSATNDEASLNENEGVNIKELVSDYSSGNIKSGSASITSQELIVKESDGKESVYNLSGEEFFVSIAPYINESHP